MTRHMSLGVGKEDLVRLAVLIALFVGFAVATDGVTSSPRGISNILLQTSVVGIVAVGQTFVMLTGGIDLSLYGIGALASIVGAMTLTERFDLNIVGGDPVPLLVGVSIIIIVAVVMGALNGAVVAGLRVPALIATLGTWQISLGVAQLIGGGYTITGLPGELARIGQGSVAGIPLPVVQMLSLFAIAYFILHHTSFGRSIYAVGGDPESAHLSGISVRWITFAVFVIAGLMVGLAAVTLQSRVMAASLRTLQGVHVDSIAAAAIGGVSIYGGRGTIVGVLLGTLILAVVDNGLGAMGAATNVQNIVKGAIIILAVSTDYFRRRRI